MAHEACGDPFARPTNGILIKSGLAGAEKVAAIKLIRQVSAVTLSQAKNIIDSALEEKSIPLEVSSIHNVDEILTKLNNLGFRGELIWSSE